MCKATLILKATLIEGLLLAKICAKSFAVSTPHNNFMRLIQSPRILQMRKLRYTEFKQRVT